MRDRPILRRVIGDGVAHAERLALCDLLRRLGPHAPTLCDGWETRHMAAHLVVRDTQPLSLPGDFLQRLHPVTAHFEERMLRSHGYGDLVTRLRRGPPLTAPMGLPGLREVVNVHEFFVHHEDVRRPNGLRRRRLGRDLTAALWVRLRVLGPYLVRNLRGLHVEVRSGDRRLTLLPGAGHLQLNGPVGELVMFVFNRRDSAGVRVEGSPAAIARLHGTRLGI